MDRGQFLRETRASAKFSPHLDPEPPFFFLEGPGWASRDALAAENTLFQIHNRPFSGQVNGAFPAGIDAGFALNAGFRGDFRTAGSDQTEV